MILNFELKLQVMGVLDHQMIFEINLIPEISH